jgi:hypothetical protein
VKARGNRLTEEQRAEAIRLLRTGMSNIEVGKQTGMSEGSVRLLKKTMALESAPPAAVAPVEAPAPKPAPAAVAPVEAPAPVVLDSLGRARQLQSKAFALAEAAERDGNHTAAARALRDAGAQALLIARLEKAAALTQDAITLPREEIERAVHNVKERLQTLANVPLTCPDCGREMRIKRVKGE